MVFESTVFLRASMPPQEIGPLSALLFPVFQIYPAYFRYFFRIGLSR